MYWDLYYPQPSRGTAVADSVRPRAFQTKLFVQKEMTIKGSRNATPKDFRAVIHYLQQGTCPINELITACVKPEEALTAMKQWTDTPGKVFRILVDFTR